MSIWDDFTSTIGHYISSMVSGAANSLPNAAVSAAGGLVDAGTNAAVRAAAPTTKLPSTGTQLAQVARDQIAANSPFKVIPIKPSQDLLLKTAVFAENKIISPYVTRPFSTFGLMTDFSSAPLYHDGFQWDDFKVAYNRSKYVSPFQALIKSDIYKATPLGDLTTSILKKGGVDLDKVDLWDNQSIKKSFHDNVVGKWFTGTGDFVESFAEFGGAGKVVGAVAKFGKYAAVETGLGALSKDYTLTQVENDMTQGIQHATTGVGTPTVRGAEVMQMAQTTDPSVLIPKIQKYTTNANLIPLIMEETNPAVIRDLLLADSGHIPALERLAQNGSSDYLMVASDTHNYLKSEAIANNNSLNHLPDDALAKINKAFDDSIARVPEHKRFLDALMDPSTNSPLFGGTGYFPAEPIVGAKEVAAVRKTVSETGAALKARDYSAMGSWAERVLGNRILTRVVRTTGSRSPMGIVGFNGSRPFDAFAEINAQLDNIKVLENGATTIEYEWGKTATASEYRKAVLAAYAKQTTDIGRREIISQLDEHLGHIIARYYGINTAEEIKGYVAAIRGATQDSYSKLVKNGFSVDMNGRLTLSPETQSQLAQSYRFAPWDAFEQDIIRAQTKGNLAAGKRFIQSSGQITRSVLEDGVKYWSFDALARPAFIFKQSYMEPIISATIAQGADFFIKNLPNALDNSLKNNINRFIEASTKVTTLAERKEVSNTVTRIQEQLKTALQNRDMLAAEWEQMYKSGKLSPRTTRENSAYIKSELKKYTKIVDSLEAEIHDAVRPLNLGDESIVSVPSIANLERRIAYIEQSVPSLRNKMGKTIKGVKKSIAELQNEIISLSPDGKKIVELNNKIASAYEDIDMEVKNLGSVRARQADTFGRGTEFKKRYYGKESQYRMVAGKWTNIESLFNDNLLGAAMRDELSNTMTAYNTYAGDMNIGARQAIYSRRAPSGIIDIYHDDYFKELAHVTNQLWRNDPFIKLILADTPKTNLVKWLKDNPSYLDQWEFVKKPDLSAWVDNKVSLVNRYLPSAEVKDALLKGPVTDIQMQKMLSGKMDRLTAIQPTDFNYDGLSTRSATVRGVEQIEAGLNRGIGFIFKQLARPENPIRWAYADTKFTDIVAKKANILASQGVDLTGPKGLERINALRQAAVRETIKDTEATFYTVRRPLRAIQAARLAMSFPTATLSAFYRYGRLAVKNPYNTMGFLHYYQGAFGNFGVDQYGNHVTDPMEAQYLVVPGTEDLPKMFGAGGVRLNAKSLGFLLNYPSPSIYTSLSVGAIQKNFPNSEDVMKTIMGQYYDVVFPFGTQTGVAESMTPGWARDGFNWIRGPKARKDWQASVQSVWDYHATLREMGLEKNTLTEKQVIDEANHLFHVKAAFEFASPAGVPIKVDTKPFDIFTQYYKILFNKYSSQGLSYEDAKTKAGDEMISHLGADFPVDRAATGNHVAKFYMPSTMESYKRVMVDNKDLVAQLYDLGKKDPAGPKLLELLTYDVPNTDKFNNTVYNLISDPNAKLPNGELMNNIIPSIAKKEEILSNNRTWNLYFAHKQMILDLPQVKSAGFTAETFTRIPGASNEMKLFADTVLKKQNPTWWSTEFQPQSTADKAYIWTAGLWAITHNQKFMDAHGQNKFWQDAKQFVELREEVAKIYNSYPSGSQMKTMINRVYPTNVENTMLQWHPKLQELIQKYLMNDSLKAVNPNG